MATMLVTLTICLDDVEGFDWDYELDFELNIHRGEPTVGIRYRTLNDFSLVPLQRNYIQYFAMCMVHGKGQVDAQIKRAIERYLED